MTIRRLRTFGSTRSTIKPGIVRPRRIRSRRPAPGADDWFSAPRAGQQRVGTWPGIAKPFRFRFEVRYRVATGCGYNHQDVKSARLVAARFGTGEGKGNGHGDRTGRDLA